MIKLQVIGNLGRDCVQNSVNGKNVINFSVAHTERYKDSLGNQQDRTIWVECAYWTDRVAIVPYLLKGTTVYVEGTPEADSYTNKEGKASATLRCRVSSIQLIGGRKQDGNEGATSVAATYSSAQQSSSNSNSNEQNSTVVAANTPNEVDDLPF